MIGEFMGDEDDLLLPPGIFQRGDDAARARAHIVDADQIGMLGQHLRGDFFDAAASRRALPGPAGW